MDDSKSDGTLENSDDFSKESESLLNGSEEEVQDEFKQSEESEVNNEETTESNEKDPLAESSESDDNAKQEEPAEYLRTLRSRPSRTSRSSRTSSTETKPKQDAITSPKDTNGDTKSDDGMTNNNNNNNNGNSFSDEEEFLGFDRPNTTRRDAFLKLIGKDNEVSHEETSNQKNSSEVPNDENSMNVDAEHSGDSGETSSVPPRKSVSNKVNKKLSNVNINDPKFKKPFELGWMRELVYRSTGDSALKRNADVYYFTPSGKKLRSAKEVSSQLPEELTIENFTFAKEPIGIADKEIVREAKTKGNKIPEDGILRKKTTPKVTKPTPSKQVKGTPTSETPSSKGSLTPRVVFKGSSSTPKGKTSVAASAALKQKSDTKKRRSDSDETESQEAESEWSSSSEQKSKSNGVKRIKLKDDNDSPVEGSSPPPEKKIKRRDNAQDNRMAQPNFMMNLNVGFTALLHAFHFLKVHELLRASCVSKAFEMIAHHESLWATVRMKNSMVRDWNGFGRALRLRNTKALDLRKMLLPETPDAIAEMWVELGKAVSNLPSLSKIDLGRCTPQAVEIVTKSCPQLESLVTLAIRGPELDLAHCAKCTNLTELRIKSIGGIDLKNISELKNLKALKHLALTTIKNLSGIEEVLPEHLESLELGECTNLPESIATEALIKLKNLRRLRLEKGQVNCPTAAFLQAVAKLPNLVQLELINFDIKPGFDVAIGQCTNLKTLLIIPTYVTQSATTNHVVMGGVSKLSQSLTYFIWGLTLELLRVTDLFIDQVEGQKNGNTAKGVTAVKKPGAGDSIPILKPLSECNTSSSDTPVEEVSDIVGKETNRDEKNTSQVDILALPKLQKVLSTLLPNTKIKILKVPFSATWRQTVTDSPTSN